MKNQVRDQVRDKAVMKFAGAAWPLRGRPKATAARAALLSRTALAGALALSLLLQAGFMHPAQANPKGGTVAAGSATIAKTSNKRLEITQQSDKAIINWQGFSIAGDETTRFVQPSRGSIALNRVTGADLSRIEGALSANGNIFLVNPNGVVFGQGARVNVGGLIASTANLADDDFLAGRYDFNLPGQPGAAVINQGAITIADQGLAALVAPGVENSGVISANLGQIVLAGAETFSLDMAGDGLLSFAIGSGVGDAPTELNALVTNSGTLSANGGSVLLTAEVAGAVVDSAINMTGVIEARSASVDQNGAITLSGGSNGMVEVSGSLDASGYGDGQSGGRVEVLGEQVAIWEGSRIDASGDAGGGEVYIGGNYQGAGPLPNASRTLVEQGAEIAADAIGDGDGGTVVVWADEATRFDGEISARGGTQGGNGGLVETSGKQVLQVFTGAVDTRAPLGDGGIWLLDPEDVIISLSAVFDPPVFFDDAALDGDGVTTTIDASALNLGAGQTIILQAQDDVLVFSGFDTAGANVVLQAGDTIGVFGNIDTNGGGLHLEADSPHATGGFNDGGGALNFDASVTTGGGAVTLIAAVFNGMPIDAGGGSVHIARSDGALIFDSAQISQGILNELSNVGALVLGYAETAGTDGLGKGSQILQTGVEGTFAVQGTGATSLGLFGVGTLNVAGDVTTLAVDAAGQTVTYVDDDDFTVGTVSALSGITAQDLSLTGNNITFDVAHSAPGDHTIAGTGAVTFNAAVAVPGVLEIDAGNDVTFAASVDGPGSLFIGGAGDIFFDGAVGTSSTLANVIVGKPNSVLGLDFPDIVALIGSDGVEVASRQLANIGNDVTISDSFLSQSIIFRVGNVAFGLGGGSVIADNLLVSGSGASLEGIVQGVPGAPAAAFAFSDAPIVGFDDSGNPVFGSFTPEFFTLNTCVIETTCAGPPVVIKVPPTITTPTITTPTDPIVEITGTPSIEITPLVNVSSEQLEGTLPFLLDPTLAFLRLLEPTSSDEEDLEGRFSNSGNEEIW